jgi:hypothetical protein
MRCVTVMEAGLAGLAGTRGLRESGAQGADLDESHEAGGRFTRRGWGDRVERKGGLGSAAEGPSDDERLVADSLSLAHRAGTGSTAPGRECDGDHIPVTAAAGLACD